MNKKVVCILICGLLIANVYTVLGMSEENVDVTEKGKSYIFNNSSSLENIKYIKLDNYIQNDITGNIFTNEYPNLAPNPSFEDGDTMPMGWTYNPNDDGTFHWDSKYFYTGEKSIGILGLKQNGSEYSSVLYWTTTDFIPIDLRSSAYDIFAWYKNVGTPANDQWASIRILFYDENFTELGWNRMGVRTNHSEWWEDGFGFYHWDEDYEEENENLNYLIKLELGQHCYITNKPNSSFENRFDNIYLGVRNTIPDAPSMTGKTTGRIRTLYNYIITTTDPDQDKVRYHIDWGDNTYTDTDFYASDEEFNISHIWGVKGNYSIRVKAIDDSHYELQSYWTTLTLKLSCAYDNTPLQHFYDWLFQRFPNAFPLLRQLMGY